MSQRLRTNVVGEAYPHRTLWICAKTLFKTARNESKGAKYPDMAACLMAYFAYEAYLNLLISRLDKDTWEKERAFFSKGKYQGIEGKLRWISEKCGAFTWDKGDRPYQTIAKMAKLRDRMAHGKPYQFSSTTEHSEDEEPDWWPRDAYHDVRPEFVSEVIQDFEEFMEFVHNYAKPQINDPWLKDGALGGSSAHASSSTTPAT